MIPIIDSLLKIGGTVLDRVIPDVAARDKAKAEFQVQILQQETALVEAFTKIDQGQLEINKEEAKSNSLFVSGWRPFVGWTCGVGTAWAFVVKPFADWTVALASRFYPQLIGFQTPVVNTGELMSLLLGLLGMGAMRTYEKFKGVAR